MAGSNDKNRLNYGASNYKPSGGRSSISFGGVGSAVRDFSSPGRSFGSGVGATLRTPVKMSKAKGGAIKKSGCEVKAYGDMIRAVGKKANGGKVQTSSDTARKLATEMGGMKKGGVQKKADGGMPQTPKPQMPQMPKPETGQTPPKPKTQIYVDPPAPSKAQQLKNREREVKAKIDGFKTRLAIMEEEARNKLFRKNNPQSYAPMGDVVAKDPRAMAKGGAGKVRKGMMSPQGTILQAVKPKKGLGGM